MTHLQAAFDLLGVSPDSDPDTVKRAWRALVRSNHPDMGQQDPEAANRRLAEINAAFDAVSATIKTERHRRRAEATERARKCAEAAERARLEALALREMVQERAARAAFTEAATPPRKPGQRAMPLARRGAQPGDRAKRGTARKAGTRGSGDGRKPWDLLRLAVAALGAVPLAFARQRKA